jgi:hypothetical protein
MRSGRAALITLVAATIALPGVALAQEDLTISIARKARLTAGGFVIIRADISCDPLPGTEDFQEVVAGATQARSGAEGEGGIDGVLVCDGIERTYTARVSPFTDEVFRRGPARASVSVTICNLVGEEQVCLQGSAERRIIIRGRAVP